MTGPALHLDLLPVAWLVGVWRGAGFVVESGPDGSVEVPVELEMTFRHYGHPVLGYALRVTRQGVEEAGEVGWWRVAAGDDPGKADLEVLLVHPTGVLEEYAGVAAAATVHLATDAVFHTHTGDPVLAAKRQYGVRGGQLVFVVDESRDARGLVSRLSGGLERDPGTGWDGISQG